MVSLSNHDVAAPVACPEPRRRDKLRVTTLFKCNSKLCYRTYVLEALILAICMLLLSLQLPIWVQLLILSGVLILIIPSIVAMLGGAPFVPSNRSSFLRMMEWAKIKKGERVYDLGCGDGRFIFAAAAAGAKATGYELSIPVWLLAKIRSFFHPHSSIRYADFWKQDYRDADVVFCYLLPKTMQTFKKKIWPQLKPKTRVISHAFAMEGVKPEKKEGTVMLYVKK